MLGRKIGRTFLIAGLLMVVIGISTAPAQGSAINGPLAQPSPRPTLEPTATTVMPTVVVATATAATSTDSNAQVSSTLAAFGHITGTIIDLTTGAPTPGMTVNIGGVLVTSDANGNYDHWLPVGSYGVSLVVSPNQGTSAQGVQKVQLTKDNPVVLHLGFQAAPTGAPKGAPSATAAAGAAPVPQPTRLPRTADQPSSLWLWGFGALLLMAGSALELRSRMRRATISGTEQTRILTELLAIRKAPMYPTEIDEQALLTRLLDDQPRGRRH